MREIKFRAWDKENGRMLYDVQDVYDSPFSPAKNEKGEDIDDCVGQSFKDVIRLYEVIQYTGLKDKNGKEIYEGDIVCNYYLNGREYSRHVVEWGKCNIGCNGHEYSFEVYGPYVDDEYAYGELINGNLTVIGNIYENKDLLNKQHETN